LAREAKAIAALAFRNGPLEDLHAGTTCPQYSGAPEYSRITDQEMRATVKAIVDRIYTLLWLKKTKPDVFAVFVELGSMYTSDWDEPDLTSDF